MGLRSFGDCFGVVFECFEEHFEYFPIAAAFHCQILLEFSDLFGHCTLVSLTLSQPSGERNELPSCLFQQLLMTRRWWSDIGCRHRHPRRGGVGLW